jgi:hypothetical protein
LTAISGSRDGIPPLFMTNNKTFDAAKWTEKQFYHRYEYEYDYDYDYVIRIALKPSSCRFFQQSVTSSTLPRNQNLRVKRNHSDPVIFLVDRHASHITPRVVVFATSQNSSLSNWLHTRRTSFSL